MRFPFIQSVPVRTSHIVINSHHSGFSYRPFSLTSTRPSDCTFSYQTSTSDCDHYYQTTSSLSNHRQSTLPRQWILLIKPLRSQIQIIQRAAFMTDNASCLLELFYASIGKYTIEIYTQKLIHPFWFYYVQVESWNFINSSHCLSHTALNILLNNIDC